MDDNFDDIIDSVVNECSYINCGDFRCNGKNKLSIMHINSRSLFKKIEDLVALLSCIEHNLSVIGISETWFKPSTDVAMFDIPGYSFTQVCRSNKKGGGVACYVREGLDYKLRNDLSTANASYESVFIEISIANTKSIVGCVYRAPGNDIRSFIDGFDHEMQILSKEKKDIYIMGDFNINLLNVDVDDKVKEFVDFMCSFGLFSLITKPTRVSSFSATLIDNIFTNCVKDDFCSGIFCSDFSDHMPICSINKGNTITTGKVNCKVFRRVITDERINIFRQDLLDVDWSSLYNLFDVNVSYDYFNDIFSNLYNLHFPIVELSAKKKCRKPWITPSLLKSINQKHKLYYTYIKNQNEINRKRYVDYKNLLTNLVRQSKKNYYDDVFRTTQNDIRKTWSHINELLGKGKKTPLPNDMYHNEVLLKSDIHKAEYFNKYFIDLPFKISKEIPPVQTSYKNFLSVQNHSSSLYFRPTSVHEISNFVSILKSSKSCGSDDISPKVIKKCIQCIVDPLCDIFNKSLSQGIVPDKLKIAKVVPVFKKNDRKSIENYRPIALSPIFSKIIEKIV